MKSIGAALVGLGMISLFGCVGRQMVKPLAPGLDDSSTYRKVTEVRLIGCHKTDGPHPRTVSVVESLKEGVRFQLEGCYGNANEIFKIIQ
jgi:hypothetical protein